MIKLLSNIATIVAPILLLISYVPQIIKLIKTKNAAGISLSFWVILDLTLWCFVVIAMSSGDTRMLVMQLLNLILAILITILVLMYKEG